MKDREARDGMVQRVQDAYTKYPTFFALPEVSGGDIFCTMPGSDESAYVKALYVIAANGEVTGRKDNAVYGKAVSSEPIQGEVTMRKGTV